MSRVVSGGDTVSSHPVSYDSGYSAYSVSGLDQGCTDSSSTTYGTINLTRGSGAETYIFYNFDFNIPSGSTISSISATGKCYISTTNSGRVATKQIQLYANGNAKGSATTVSNSTNAMNMSPGAANTWTAAEVNNMKIRVYGKRGTSNTSTTYYFRFYGATVTVTYSYNYTLYTVTSSSSVSGVTASPASEEYMEGTEATVTFDGINNLSDVIVTDNNTDVTSSLVYHQYTNPSYSVGSVSGASYGFALSSSWYESQNKGVSNSAALCRVTISSVVQCRVTFTYINYAEATYDFGIFSKADTALTLDYPVSTSGGDTTIDNGLYEKRCNSSSDNSSSQQTLQYTLAAGEHFIDVKFGKDAASDSGNDSLRFQVSVTALEPIPTGGYYTYTISNIQADHTVLVSSAQVDKKLYIKLNNVQTQVASKTSNDPDNNPINNVEIPFGTIVAGDTVKVTLTNMKRYKSGLTTTIGDWEVTFVRPSGYNGYSEYWYYYANGTSGQGISFHQTAPNTSLGINYPTQIRPYESDYGLSYSYSGTVTVYKLESGWAEVTEVYIKRNNVWATVSKVYKKSSNSWTQLEDPHLMFDPNAIFISGL